MRSCIDQVSSFQGFELIDAPADQFRYLSSNLGPRRFIEQPAAPPATAAAVTHPFRHFPAANIPTRLGLPFAARRCRSRTLETSPGLNVVIKMHMVSCRHAVVPRQRLNETSVSQRASERRERTCEKERKRRRVGTLWIRQRPGGGHQTLRDHLMLPTFWPPLEKYYNTGDICRPRERRMKKGIKRLHDALYSCRA